MFMQNHKWTTERKSVKKKGKKKLKSHTSPHNFHWYLYAICIEFRAIILNSILNIIWESHKLRDMWTFTYCTNMSFSWHLCAHRFQFYKCFASQKGPPWNVVVVVFLFFLISFHFRSFPVKRCKKQKAKSKKIIIIICKPFFCWRVFNFEFLEYVIHMIYHHITISKTNSRSLSLHKIYDDVEPWALSTMSIHHIVFSMQALRVITHSNIFQRLHKLFAIAVVLCATVK